MKKSDYAVISVDMHRGHLDPEVATLPLLPKERCTRVINNTGDFFKEIRKKDIPIIHVVTTYRDGDEIISNPHWGEKDSETEGSREGISQHNIAGSPGTEIIPDLYEKEDYIVNTKKRYSCFYETDLEFLLEQIGAKTVIITGINTSSCVLCTSFDACNRDYKVYVAEDCCDSMDGEEFHDAAVMFINRILGTTLNSKDLLEKL
ncbi:MAG: cysteine hydrolase family protein [Bacillota bacterium]